MAVAIDTSTSTVGTSGTTIDLTLTVAANSNTALVVMTGNSDTLTISSVAYTVGSGGAFAKLNATVAGARETEIWSSVAPSSGSVTVRVTFSGTISGTGAFCAMYSLYGVDQSTPVQNYLGGGSVNTLTITTSAANIALCHVHANADPNPLTGCAAAADTTTNGAEFHRTMNCNGSPSVVFSWTTGGRCCAGCDVLAAAGAASAITILIAT